MATPATKVDTGPSLESQVVEIVRELLLEQGKTAIAQRLNAQSSLQKDLGLASLDLVELVVRCEAKLDIEVPDEIAEQADTPAGWAKAIQQGSQDAAAKSVYRIVPPKGDAPPAPAHARTLVEVLRWHAEATPGRTHIHLLEKGSGQGITCSQLLDEAETVARGLISKGLRPNDPVAILLPTSAEFLQAFFGVMIAGGIPVPIYPPANPSRIGEYVRRHLTMLGSLKIRFLIAFDRVQVVSRLLRVNIPVLGEVTTVRALHELGRRASGRLPNPSGTALVQHTSGSTADPKAIFLRHEDVIANFKSLGKSLAVRGDDAVVSWLPLASDMGLLGCWLFSLYHAMPLTLIPPQEFIERPESWLWAIHDSRGTLSGGPNFAFELCTRRIPMWTLEGIDLSCWRVAVNAGEMVRSDTVARFSKRFKSAGFRAESMTPAYGLAEAAVALTIPPVGRIPREHNGVFSVGLPLEGHEVRIEDDHVFFKLTGEPNWTATGDRGFLNDGELFITGRDKDVILTAGRSLAPHGIESAVGDVAGVHAFAAAAIGVPDPASGTEKFVIVAESGASTEMDIARVRDAVAATAADAAGVAPDMVLLIEPGTLPVTSNGKLRRNEVKRLFLEGRLGESAGPAWAQVASLWGSNFAGLLALGLRRAGRRIGLMLRANAARLTTIAAGSVIRLTGSGSMVPGAARLVLSVLGRHPKHEGPELTGPSVIVSNRCSRLDALTIAAMVKGRVVFAGEESLIGLPPLAAFLLRTVVARTPEVIRQAIGKGCVVVVLPDGPVGATAPRSRFRLDALEVALETKCPVFPLALQEMRHQTLSRSGQPIEMAANENPRSLRDKVRDRISHIYA